MSTSPTVPLAERIPPRARRILVAGFFAAQLLIPARYYFGDDLYDERFAWRMFSPIRMVQCAVTIREESGGSSRTLDLDHEMAQPWVNWMERGHRRVVLGFARDRCARARAEGRPLALHADVVCPLPDGRRDRLFDPREDLCQRP